MGGNGQGGAADAVQQSEDWKPGQTGAGRREVRRTRPLPRYTPGTWAGSRRPHSVATVEVATVTKQGLERTVVTAEANKVSATDRWRPIGGSSDIMRWLYAALTASVRVSRNRISSSAGRGRLIR